MTQGYETKVSSFDEYWDKENVRFDDSYHKHKETYDLGAASRQAEIDELQKKYDAMYNAFVMADDCRKEWHRCYVGIRKSEDKLHERVKELELINFDSELHFVAAKEHIDNLQNRIDDLKSFCIKGVESNMLSIEYNQALIDMHKILKGE